LNQSFFQQVLIDLEQKDPTSLMPFGEKLVQHGFYAAADEILHKYYTQPNYLPRWITDARGGGTSGPQQFYSIHTLTEIRLYRKLGLIEKATKALMHFASDMHSYYPEGIDRQLLTEYLHLNFTEEVYAHLRSYLQSFKSQTRHLMTFPMIKNSIPLFEKQRPEYVKESTWLKSRNIIKTELITVIEYYITNLQHDLQMSMTMQYFLTLFHVLIDFDEGSYVKPLTDGMLSSLQAFVQKKSSEQTQKILKMSDSLPKPRFDEEKFLQLISSNPMILASAMNPRAMAKNRDKMVEQYDKLISLVYHQLAMLYQRLEDTELFNLCKNNAQKFQPANFNALAAISQQPLITQIKRLFGGHNYQQAKKQVNLLLERLDEKDIKYHEQLIPYIQLLNLFLKNYSKNINSN